MGGGGSRMGAGCYLLTSPVHEVSFKHLGLRLRLLKKSVTEMCKNLILSTLQVSFKSICSQICLQGQLYLSIEHI